LAIYFGKTQVIFLRQRRQLRLAGLLWALPALFNFPALCGQVPDLQNTLKAAATAEQSGHYEEAAAVYQKVLSHIDSSKADPSIVVHVRTRLATAYFLLHRYRESLDAIAPLTSKDSLYALPAQAWLVEGLDYVETNQLPEAIQALRRAIELNPESGTARLALGDALARSHDLEGAVEQYNEQLRRTPNVADAWYKLGFAYAQLAKDATSQFLRLYPQDPVGQQLKAAGLIASGDYAGALRILFSLLQRNPSQAGLCAELGVALLGLGFPQTAEKQFRKELVRNPHSPEALFGMAQVMALRGNWDAVSGNLEALSRFNPRELARLFEVPPPAVLRQAWERGQIVIPAHFAQTPGAQVWESWLREAGPNMDSLLKNDKRTCPEAVTPAQLEPGVWVPEACYLELADQLRKQKGLSQTQTVKLAETELRLGDPESASVTAQHALKLQPSDGWAMYWLVQSYDALAYQAFLKVSKLEPDSARVHQMLAKYYADRHETSRAVAEYEAALKLSPDLPDLQLGLGSAYWEAGDWDRAEQPLRKAIELSPGSLAASYELGDLYVQKRQWELAIPYLRPAVADEALNYKTRLDLSKAEAALGHTQQAVECLLPVADQDQDGELHYRLATLYRKLGDSERAEAALAASNQLHRSSAQHGQEVLQTMEEERQALEKLDH
jgi:tetratricopeptide (TPR) repeat protein